jgi:hypothetical protein
MANSWWNIAAQFCDQRAGVAKEGSRSPGTFECETESRGSARSRRIILGAKSSEQIQDIYEQRHWSMGEDTLQQQPQFFVQDQCRVITPFDRITGVRPS